MTKQEAYKLVQTMYEKTTEFKRTGDTNIAIEVIKIQEQLLTLPKDYLRGYKGEDT